ncbi:MAG: DnaA/Hda family protein [Planctomycetota bacterium]|nr:DnaA/Hda family protein [Planctomycetota bacterium]MDA1211601.1 DnaA/Hda family protein [Planctomycetota bacterium]
MATLEPFLKLPENRLAFDAVHKLLAGERISGSQKTPPPLIYVHGPSGVGKSLMLRHLLKEWRKTHRGHTVDLLTASDFVARFAEACDNKQADTFEQSFLQSETWVCEDLQAIESRRPAQRMLTLLLDEFSRRGTNVVLTADRSPGQFSSLESRLLNRIRGGLVVPIRLPGKSSRIQLLQAFAQSRSLPLTEDSLATLATALPVSPCELKSVVNQLEHHVRTRKVTLDKGFLKRFLKEETAGVKVSPKQIVNVAAAHFGVSPAQILSTSRRQSVVEARRCVMALSAELSGLSHTAIAKFFGRNNHSCVSQACKEIKHRLTEEVAWRQHWSALHRLLRISDQRATD